MRPYFWVPTIWPSKFIGRTADRLWAVSAWKRVWTCSVSRSLCLIFQGKTKKNHHGLMMLHVVPMSYLCVVGGLNMLVVRPCWWLMVGIPVASSSLSRLFPSIKIHWLCWLSFHRCSRWWQHVATFFVGSPIACWQLKHCRWQLSDAWRKKRCCPTCDGDAFHRFEWGSYGK